MHENKHVEKNVFTIDNIQCDEFTLEECDVGDLMDAYENLFL